MSYYLVDRIYALAASTSNVTADVTLSTQLLQQLNDVTWVSIAKIVVAILAVLIAGDILQHKYIASKVGTPYLLVTKEGVALPFLGQALTFLSYRPWDLMTGWHRAYDSPIVGFPLLGANMFSIASPSLLKIVLQSKIASVKKDVKKIMKPFLSILGTGIVSSEGHSWMKQRVKMSNPLRQDVLEIIPRQTLHAVQRLFDTMDEAASQGKEIALGEALRHLTLQVISGSFLSLSAEESDSTFATMYLPIVEEGNARVWKPYRYYLFFSPSFWNYHINVYRLNKYVSQLIRSRWVLRRKEGAENDNLTSKLDREEDILDRVLKVHEKECSGGNIDNVLPSQLDEETVRQLRDEMKTFMLAGHETSAAMMTWALYELMGNDNLMNQVAKEGESIFSKNIDWARATVEELPSRDDLANLKLCEATLRETLRKHNVVPIVARRTIEDLYMEGKYCIPKGSSVVINMQAVHLDPTIWPEPMKFDPSRFLDLKTMEAKIPEPYTFLPFIAGPRNCLGQHLALLESKMVIGMVTSRYHFSLPRGETIQVGKWDNGNDPRHRFMVPVIPKKELVVLVSRK